MTKKPKKLSRSNNREISDERESGEKPTNKNFNTQLIVSGAPQAHQDKTVNTDGAEEKRANDFFRRISARLNCSRSHSGKSKLPDVTVSPTQETSEIPTKLLKTKSDETDAGNIPLLSSGESAGVKMSGVRSCNSGSKGPTKSRVGYSALKSSNRQLGIGTGGGRTKLISRHVSVTPKTSEPAGGTKNERKSGGFGSRLSIHSMFFTSSNPPGSTLNTSKAANNGCGEST